MLLRERARARRRARRASQRQVGLDALLERGEPPLLQASRLGPGERRVGDVSERRSRARAPAPRAAPLPPPMGSSSRARSTRLGEASQIELARLDADQVARAPGDQPLRAERLAQGVHARPAAAFVGAGRAASRPRTRRSAGRAGTSRFAVEEQHRQHAPAGAGRRGAAGRPSGPLASTGPRSENAIVVPSGADTEVPVQWPLSGS